MVAQKIAKLNNTVKEVVNWKIFTLAYDKAKP